MKVCPQCAFANEERFPACLWCNALLVNVRSTPAADPAHPEHARRRRDGERYARHRREMVFASLIYGAVCTSLAVWPGMMLDPGHLLSHFGAALILATAVAWRFAGQLTAMLLHGALSTALVYFFGPLQVFVFFMLVGHILLAGVFWHWVELIEGSNR